MRAVRPDLYRGFNPWDRVCEPDSLRSLLPDAEIVAEFGTHPIDGPEGWWAVVMGSGYRGTVDQLSAEDFERVRAMNFAAIRDKRITEGEANVVYAVA